jgi:hypothetical protein
VGALLVDRHDTGVEALFDARGHASQFGRRVRGPSLLDGAVGVGGDPHAALGLVEEAVVGLDVGKDLDEVADPDLGAEAADTLGPQERQAGGAEPRQAEAHHPDDAAVEELAPGDTEVGRVRRNERHGRSGLHDGQAGARAGGGCCGLDFTA